MILYVIGVFLDYQFLKSNKMTYKPTYLQANLMKVTSQLMFPLPEMTLA